jgi:hypothetical protein
MDGEKKTVKRLDNFEPGLWMTRPFERTSEGFLAGRAIVTNVGVFAYRNTDGSVSRELRLPKEVFSRESLDSMKLKPVVNNHPTEKVTDENIQKYQVGSLGSNPSSETQEMLWGERTPPDKLTDGYHVAIDMVINKSDAIEDVLNGKRSLSMGYECDVEMAQPGSKWLGMEYDCIQRNIRYNHVAIVDAARAGDAARIRMDGVGAVLINHMDATGRNPSPKPNQEVTTMGMRKINLDGVEYEGDEKLIDSYVSEKKRADAADKALEVAKADHAKALSTMEVDRDAHKDRADKAEKDLKEAKDQAMDPKRIDEAVKAKVLLMDAADRAGVEVKDGMSDTEIRKAVIMAMYPAAKLDGKDEVYISARFDAAVEDLNRKADGESREVLGGGTPSASGRSDSAAAYRRMVDRMKSHSRGEEAK